jgi:aspartate/methionine/tyrosine aminotransferase
MPGAVASAAATARAASAIHFLVDLDEIPEDTLRRTRILYLNYPNNPTAAIAPRDYLERTVALP